MAEDSDFSFDQPWNPISYFDEEGDQDNGGGGAQYSPTRLASLFEANVSAIDEDIQRSKNIVKFDFDRQDDHLAACDTNDVNNFTLETENGLKMLDTTSTINKKSIFSDLDRIRKWQEQAGVDNPDEEQNDKKDLFLSKSPDHLFQSQESKEKSGANIDDDVDISLLLDPFSSVVDDHDKYMNPNFDSASRLKELEERMSETDHCTLPTDILDLSSPINQTEPNKLISIESGNEFENKDTVNKEGDFGDLCDLLELPDVPTVLPTSKTNMVDKETTDAQNNTDKEIDVKPSMDTDETDIQTDCANTDIMGGIDSSHNGNNIIGIDDKDFVIDQKGGGVVETVEDLINSSDTSDADQILEIASNITFKDTEQTTETDELIKIDLDENMVDVSEAPPPYIESDDDDLEDESASGVEQDPSSEDVVPNPVNVTDISTPNNTEILKEVDPKQNGSEIINDNENQSDKEILTNVEAGNVVLNMDNTPIKDDSCVENVTSDDKTFDKSNNDVSPPTDSSGDLPSSASVNIVSVSNALDSMKCLTPDEDDIEESQDMESYMETTVGEQNPSKAVSNLSTSPIPDVNFEIQEDTGISNNASIGNVETVDHARQAGNLQSAVVETPRLENMVSSELENVDDVDTVNNDNNRKDENDKDTNMGNIDELDIENSAVQEPLQTVDTPQEPVGFTEQAGDISDELDSLLDNLEEDLGMATEVIDEDSNTNITQPEEASVSVVAETAPEELVSNAALAATGNEPDQESVINSETEPDKNVGETNNGEIQVTEATGNNMTSNEETPHESIEPALTMQDGQTEELSPESLEETTPASDDQQPAQEGETELRTSLRRNGGTSGSGRRVRFSLNPEYEGENPNASAGSQNEQGESPPEGATALDSSPQQPSSGDEIPNEIKNLGWVAPEWVPDEKASNCMKCNMKFTVVKRRHHCRACGKVLCSVCCNMKYCLPYLNYKFVRVCQDCCDVMISQALSDNPIPDLTPAAINSSATQPPVAASPIPPESVAPTVITTPTTTTTTVPPMAELPQAPPPYSEAVDGHHERLGSASSDAPPYSELSPSSPTNQFTEQPAPILPAGVQGMGDVLPGNAGRNPHLTGAQLTEMMNFQLPAYTPTARQRQNRNRTESEMSAVIMFNSTATNLPPIIRRSNEETRIVNNPDLDTLFSQIRDEQEDPITFIVNKNLVVRVKIVNLDCCVEKKCWCFTSDGMGASNQEEIVVLIKCGSYDVDDRTLTRKVLQQMNHIFEKAKHGHPVSDLEQLEYDASLCCTPKNVAMLFFKHSLQCIKKLIIPTSPYLFGMYIEKSELPWAKNFPLRLLLRVGAEYKYYPCPLLNILDRPAVYDGVGRTILDLLADFRNFQYTIPRVVGVTINLRGKDTIIRLPQHRYDEIMKAVNSCEENVLSLAGNFSTTCDGHLVAVEKDGRYKTQTLSIVLKANRKVTCASFVVISAALKANQDGVKAKASIVEDGVMVQVTPEVMKEFKQAIKDMKEFSFGTGESSSASGGAMASGGDEVSSKVGIEWSSADVMDRPRLLSPIDGTSFDNLTNMKIRHSYDYTSNNLTAKIHWIEVYFLPQDSDTVQRLSARELGQMTSSVAKACMSALSAHLMTLLALDMTRIGLRVNLAADFVEYKIGANLSTLPAELLPGLDDKLVPAIHTVMSSAQERVAVELIFQVVKIV